MPRPKGLPKTGGRKKGSIDKRNAELRKVADNAVKEKCSPLQYLL
jgi:hypothetical protein